MERLQITIITYAWPPRNSIGAHRPYSFAKTWAQAGMTVRVITAKKYSYDRPLDLRLPAIPGVEVVEIPYASWLSVIASAIFSLPLGKLIHQLLRRHQPGRNLKRRNPRDAWLGAALKRVEEFADSADVVVSTFDPPTVHQLASQLKRRNPNILWVADYRDLWSRNHVPDWSAQDRADAENEELKCVKPWADVITTVSNELASVQRSLLDKPTFTITNGFDADDALVCSRLSAQLRPVSGHLRIVYTGKIYPKTRDPSPLLKAIRNLETSHDCPSFGVELHIYGDQIDLDWITPDLGSLRSSAIKFHGHVSRDVALRAQLDADLLLLLESPAIEANGVLTGKLFEYISSGVPILSLGSRADSAISTLLRKTGTGLCAGENVVEIESVLTRRHRNLLDWFKPNVEEVLKFSRNSQAHALLDIIQTHRRTRRQEGR